MPVPDYETLMLPVLRLFGEGLPNVAACLPRLRAEFALTEAEADEFLPSGRLTILQSRAHWARTYLSKAGLLHSPGRNRHAITEAGRAVLGNRPNGSTAPSSPASTGSRTGAPPRAPPRAPKAHPNPHALPPRKPSPPPSPPSTPRCATISSPASRRCRPSGSNG